MLDSKEIISDDIKTEYRQGSFLPKDYVSKPNNRPKWLEDNLKRDYDAEAEELRQELIAMRYKLGL